MARLHSVLAALSLTALAGLAFVAPAHAGGQIKFQSDISEFSVPVGTTVTITGTYKSDKTIKQGLAFTSPLDPNLLLVTALPNVVGTKTGNYSFQVKLLNPGSFDAVFGFSDKISGSPTATATASFTVTDVPEPGAVAFGVIAAGSVLGLVARRRKMA